VFEKKFSIFALPVAFSMILLLSACASTTLNSTWSDPDYQSKVSDILIVGISDNPQRRTLFENLFYDELAKIGVSSLASHSVSGLENKPTADQIKLMLPDLGVNAVIATRLLGIDEETVYHKASYNEFGRHYYDVASAIGAQQGYYERYTVVSLETNLYDVATSKLIWSAHSKNIDPKSAEAVAADLIESVIKGLKESGFI